MLNTMYSGRKCPKCCQCIMYRVYQMELSRQFSAQAECSCNVTIKHRAGFRHLAVGGLFHRIDKRISKLKNN